MGLAGGCWARKVNAGRGAAGRAGGSFTVTEE